MSREERTPAEGLRLPWSLQLTKTLVHRGCHQGRTSRNQHAFQSISQKIPEPLYLLCLPQGRKSFMLR